MPEELGTVASGLLTLALVAIAVALSLLERLGLERDIAVAVVRSFAQLAAIGFVINFIFGLESVGAVLLLLVVMVLFAAFTSASLTLTRIRDDLSEQRLKVESALALGATSRQAVSPILKTSLQRAMIPLIDSTKTAGLVFLPGAMAGMIIGGADPLEAVRLQIVVLYMLLGGVSVASIVVGLLSYRAFFTPRHQLRRS